MGLSIPDGEGVLDKKAPAGKVIAFYAVIVSGSIVATIAFLSFLGMLAGGHGEARAAVAGDRSTLEQKVDGIAADIRDVKSEQARASQDHSNMGRDIAVIKRQLGLDGLGPGAQPVNTSSIGH